jgi:hypothetical protein
VTIPVLPSVSAAAEEHADWLEWSALRDSDRRVSWSDHLRDLGIAGEEEGANEEDLGLRDSESKLDEIISELTSRANSDSYPFDVEEQGLRYRKEPEGGAYLFLLLLTLLGKDAASVVAPGDQLFEDLAAQALAAYMSSDFVSARVTSFGFPRRLEPRGFEAALAKLCGELREGGGCRTSPRTHQLKDAKLDIVAWLPFPDGLAGKLIIFGQCSTGSDWFEKIHELRPREWCELWMVRRPHVAPVGSFFVPRRIEPDRWEEASRYGGILFDRCRISALSSALPDPLQSKISTWNEEAVRQAKGAA